MKSQNFIKKLNPIALTEITEITEITEKTNNKNQLMSSISPKLNSVSTIIRSYKSAVTKHAHRLGFEFEWQSRFHDHIIRDSDEYQRIFDYISLNPENWKKDKFYAE